MATELIMPRLQDHQQSSFFHAQNQQQPQLPQWQQQQVLPSFAAPAQPQGQSSTQISPLSTSGSTSPASPKAYHTRQIRPLYMPAVLRPTEHHSKAPPTRPKADNSDDEDDKTIRSNSSFITLSGALGRLSRRSTGDSGKCVDGNWNLDAFPKPSGLPTREHWKPDHDSTVCDHSTCRRTFNYFTRRHHCRRCGNIFCDFHSAFEVPLDEAADYNPRGVPVRACEHCYFQFKEWRTSRANSSSSSDNSSASTTDTTTGASASSDATGGSCSRTPLDSPLSTSPIGCKGQPTPPSVAEVAVSVPRDWNWSTF